MGGELSKMWKVGLCIVDRNGECAAGGNILPEEKNKQITEAKFRVNKNNTTNSYVMALKK